MVFIGQDWRSPGEQWVKTDKGSWERLKLLESNRLFAQERFCDHGFHSSSESSGDSDSENESNGSSDGSRMDLESCLSSSPNNSSENSYSSSQQSRDDPLINWRPPHCHITLKSTKEVAGFNTISEAFYRLDFCNAIRDIRRFNYICKLLHLLITQNLTSLSGAATKVLFNLLEKVAWQVASNQQNIHVLHTLLHDLKKIMKRYYCWGRPLGSTLLWEQHLQTIEKICEMANTIEIKEPVDDGSKRLTDLPEELIREILLRLSDYKDLVNSGEAYDLMNCLLDEQHIWRQLCKYHFPRQQVRQLSMTNVSADGKVNWEHIFHILRKKFGLKEEYADCLFLCRHCRSLFWKSFGHPCVITQGSVNEMDKDNPDESGESEISEKYFMVPQHIPVPPQSFLKFFSL
ncbi:F-box only protein 25-like isoform X2 [Panonychus citri]|uniref:F-box only protein 25-like isoform X2 n=1 Tax=Panonychus citri TaxID=50023 RepID=UPI0023081472|nr:F-box only protein 25-like isoform X2 [Panonychus citri]